MSVVGFKKKKSFLKDILVIMSGTIWGKDVFADVVKLTTELQRLSWIIWLDPKYPGLFGWTLNAIIFIFTIRRQRKSDRHRTGDCEDQAERVLKILTLKISVLWLQDVECQQPPESEMILSYPEGACFPNTLYSAI